MAITTYTYTVRLADVSNRVPSPAFNVRAWIEPQRETFSPLAAHTDERIPLVFDGNGVATVELVATLDTDPETRYHLRAEWLRADDSGQQIPSGWSEWEFIAQVGGGDVAGMGAFLRNVWFSTFPPPEFAQRDGIYWINPDTWDLKDWS